MRPGAGDEAGIVEEVGGMGVPPVTEGAESKRLSTRPP
jgi:hypothetical protein